MRQPLTTRTEVSGHRFLRRRIVLSLAMHNPDPERDILRSQTSAFFIGLTVAALVCGIALVMAFVKPAGRIGDHAIVTSTHSGAVYVVRREGHELPVVHPALNLASARLIAETTEPAVAVADSELARYSRGPLVGIAGAPVRLPGHSQTHAHAWALCDQLPVDRGRGIVTTIVIDNASPKLIGVQSLKPTAGVLVSVDGHDYLVFDGHRSRINLADPAVVAALGGELAPRPVSAALLNAFDERPEIRPPNVPDEHAVPDFAFAGYRVGSVVQTQHDEDALAHFFVVMRNGIQEVGPFVADLIRYRATQTVPRIPLVSPAVIAAAPRVKTLAVKGFPRIAPQLRADRNDSVLCARWKPETDRRHREILAGGALRLGDAAAVSLAQADYGGPNVDRALIAPGTSFFARAEGGPSMALVSDTGVRYGLDNLIDAKLLGLRGSPQEVPAAILDTLPRGPRLTRADALVVHDGFEPDRRGVDLVAREQG